MHRAKMQKTSYHLCNRSSCKNAKVANRNYAKKKRKNEKKPDECKGNRLPSATTKKRLDFIPFQTLNSTNYQVPFDVAQFPSAIAWRKKMCQL